MNFNQVGGLMTSILAGVLGGANFLGAVWFGLGESLDARLSLVAGFVGVANGGIWLIKDRRVLGPAWALGLAISAAYIATRSSAVAEFGIASVVPAMLLFTAVLLNGWFALRQSRVALQHAAPDA